MTMRMPAPLRWRGHARLSAVSSGMFCWPAGIMSRLKISIFTLLLLLSVNPVIVRSVVSTPLRQENRDASDFPMNPPSEPVSVLELFRIQDEILRHAENNLAHARANLDKFAEMMGFARNQRA